MDEVVKRVMPHSNEAEQAVIGSMLMDPKAISVAGETISADDFYQKNYAELFKAMMTLSSGPVNQLQRDMLLCSISRRRRRKHPSESLMK